MDQTEAKLRLGTLPALALLASLSVLGCEDSRPRDTLDGGMQHAEAELQLLLNRDLVTIEGGRSALLEVMVPEDTIALAIVVEGDPSESYSIEAWVDPGGAVLVDAGWTTRHEDGVCRSCANTVSWFEGSFATIAPDNPESRLLPGLHSFRILSSTLREELRLSVFAKEASEAPASASLNLQLYFTGAHGWTASSAPSSAFFQATFARVTELLSAVGLRVGAMRYEDIDARFQVLESSYGPDNDLSELLSQSRRDPDDYLNLFFVDELYAGHSESPREMQSIIGISPNPGPPRTHGTVNSGVVITTWSTLGLPESEQWPDALAHTIAHEIGHHLGLMHTTEFDGLTHDRLPDTAEDERLNLMHADPDPEGGTLSPWQAKILRESIWTTHP